VLQRVVGTADLAVAVDVVDLGSPRSVAVLLRGRGEGLHLPELRLAAVAAASGVFADEVEVDSAVLQRAVEVQHEVAL
jgi:hypothetical protein